MLGKKGYDFKITSLLDKENISLCHYIFCKINLQNHLTGKYPEQDDAEIWRIKAVLEDDDRIVSLRQNVRVAAEARMQEGMEVEENEVLGQIDTLQLHLQKVQIQAQLNSLKSSRPDIESQVASLKSQTRNIKSEKARLENLIAKGAAPQKQLDDICTQIEVLENQLHAQQSSSE